MDLYHHKDQPTPCTMDSIGQSRPTYKESLNLHQHNQDRIHRQIDEFPITLASKQDQKRILFSNRSHIGIRQAYIYKVLGNISHQCLPSLKQQNVFIFDWDDTFLCTNFITCNKLNRIEEQHTQIFNCIDQLCFKILKLSIDKGIIFIISNSSNVWLRYSSHKYLPKSNQVIWNNNRIRVLSARDLYQTKYPENILKWKLETFKKIKQNVSLHIITNMICVGDSEDQMIASELLAKDFKEIYLKKIKLEPKPSPEELLKQLETLYKKFDDVYSAVMSISIKLAKKILSQEKSLLKNLDKNHKKQLRKEC